MATTLYRCKTPTDVLCPCGRVARRLRAKGVEYDQVRVAVLRRDRPEIADLTGQRWVPVLVNGQDVVHDWRRIAEYIERLEPDPASGEAEATSGGAKTRSAPAPREAAR
jgi:glutathione S-transferase